MLLSKEIRFLEARVEYLKYKSGIADDGAKGKDDDGTTVHRPAGPDAPRDTTATNQHYLFQAELYNKRLADALQQQHLEVAALQSMMRVRSLSSMVRVLLSFHISTANGGLCI